MDKIIFCHRSAGYGSSLLLAVFSLSFISSSVNAAISSDCSGSSYCTNKTIDANTAGYIDKSPVYFWGIQILLFLPARPLIMTKAPMSSERIRM